MAMAPANLWPILFAGLSLLTLALAHSRNKKQAFVTGWLFGFGYFLFSLSWIGNALLVEGNPYKWAWPLAVSGLPALLAFFPAFSTLLSYKFLNLKTIPGALGFVLIFTTFEYLRGHILTGFPWNLYGYTWVDIAPIVQIVSLGNIYALTSLTILWACTPGFLLLVPKKAAFFLAGLSLISFAACFTFGIWRLHKIPSEYYNDISIKIVQPDIDQADKWKREEMAKHFLMLLELSKPQGDEKQTTYIIWPETATSHWFTSDPTAMEELISVLKSYAGDAYIFTGIFQRNPETGAPLNALVMIDKNGTISNTYVKHHLVPFGEYIPFQKWIPLTPIVAFSGFETGLGAQSFQTPQGLSYSPLICYEVIFPGAVTSAAPPRPDFIINVTNDGWYGDSAGPRQHLTQAIFRAVEEGIPVIRSANTGISALITPLGEVKIRSELFTRSARESLLPRKIERSLKPAKSP